MGRRKLRHQDEKIVAIDDVLPAGQHIDAVRKPGNALNSTRVEVCRSEPFIPLQMRYALLKITPDVRVPMCQVCFSWEGWQCEDQP
jgi:hypothetical protein